MLPERLNGLTDQDLERLQEEYENATPEEKRSLEIRELGYIITKDARQSGERDKLYKPE